ncbi:MAG TPA: type II secretion system F family protein [Dehalococcoidia bacterium]|nr:type II secretion system F family protein [Dehalococcoidia bacterium]
MEPLLLIIAVLISLAVALLILALTSRAKTGARLSERLDAFRDAPATAENLPAPEVWRVRSGERLQAFNLFFGRMRGADTIAQDLDRAGIPLRVGEFYLVRYGVAAFLFIAALLLTPNITGVIVGLALAVTGYFLPLFFVSFKKRSRLKKIDGQLGELLSMVSNSLKAGYGLMQGLEFASRQIRPPLSAEVKRMLRDTSLGMPAEEAINGFAQRINSADIDMVVTAINIQRTVGGNLAEILDKVAFTIRERERIRGEIATLTAQQKMTAYVIGFLPVGVGALFFMLNPDYMSLLFTESLGRMMIGAAVVLEFLGIMVMRRIIAIEV